MVQSNVTSISPATHADQHRTGGTDPLTGAVGIDAMAPAGHYGSHEPGGSDHIPAFGTTIPDNDTVQTLVGAGATVKKKETTLTVCTDVLEIAFDAYRVGSVGTYEVQLRRSGVNVGAVQTPPTGGYQTFVETISGWSDGDALQVYMAASAGTTIHVRNLRILSISRYDQSGAANDP